MIPIRDTIHARTFPVFNIALIAINCVVFLFESRLSADQLNAFIATYAFTPAEFWKEPALQRFLPTLVSMFMHASWWHLGSNMLALFIFGDNVEDYLGHFRYLVLYFAGGLLADLAHLLVYPDSAVPTLGASGAIAAVLGAYFVLFPRARVLTLVPFFFFFMAEIPALIYIGFWFVSQLFNGLFSLGVDAFESGGGVAFWAHVGGFVSGVALVLLLRIGRRPPRAYPDQYHPW